MKKATEPQRAGPPGITGKPYWKDLDAARAEIAQLHGLLARVACTLRLPTSGEGPLARFQALEKFCAERDRELERLFPRSGAPQMGGESEELELTP